MPKRVLLMVSSMRGGGSERQVLLLAKHLNRTRFQPHLFLTEAKGDFLSLVPGDIPIHAFDQCGPAEGLYYPGRQLRRQVRFLREVIEQNQIDVVYERTFGMTMLGLGAGGDHRRVATIVSPPHLAVPLVESRFVALKKARLAKSYRTADAVVAVSQQAANSAESYYKLQPGSIKVIRNPIDREALLRDTTHASGPSNQTTLVCVGRMTAEKGHADLVRALPQILERWPATRAPLHLRLIGDGPLRADIKAQIEALGVARQVELVGALPSAADEIKSADALVLPSRFEGMPNVALEAMALETPVIATRAGGTVELQGEAPTAFWADIHDPASLAEAILGFARAPEQSQQHVVAASHWIAQHHDVKTAVRKIERLLDGSD